jgi:hypothetical protein
MAEWRNGVMERCLRNSNPGCRQSYVWRRLVSVWIWLRQRIKSEIRNPKTEIRRKSEIRRTANPSRRCSSSEQLASPNQGCHQILPSTLFQPLVVKTLLIRLVAKRVKRRGAKHAERRREGIWGAFASSAPPRLSRLATNRINPVQTSDFGLRFSDFGFSPPIPTS